VAFPPPYDLHKQSPCIDQFKDGFDHHSSYPQDVCSYCQSFDHDVNFCPYFYVSDEAYVSLNALVMIINERLEHFVSEMREFDLLSETDPSLTFLRLKASVYDDCESFLPLEPNIVDDAPLIDLEEVFDLPSTSLPFIAPSFSSTPVDTSVSDLTLLTSLLPLAQCMGLEMSEISRGDASVLEDASLAWSKELVLVDSCL